HYLPELARKPQAIRQVAGELIRDLGSPFGELWRELVDEDGPRYASRIFAKVLEAVVELGRPTVVQRLLAGRAAGVPVLLALRPPARHLATSPPGGAPSPCRISRWSRAEASTTTRCWRCRVTGALCVTSELSRAQTRRLSRPGA